MVERSVENTRTWFWSQIKIRKSTQKDIKTCKLGYFFSISLVTLNERLPWYLWFLGVLHTLCEKCPKYRVFSGPYLPAFGLNFQKWHILKNLDLYYRFFKFCTWKRPKNTWKLCFLLFWKVKCYFFWKSLFSGNYPIAALRILLFYKMNGTKRNI